MSERSVLLNQALNVRFDADFGNDVTVRDWLYTLLSTLWSEQENFSSKQPFGSNDWSEGLYIPLITSGFIKNGKFDENGYLVSYGNGSEFVEELIKFVFYGKTMTNHTDLPITVSSNLLRRALDMFERMSLDSNSLKVVTDISKLAYDLRTAIETGGWLPIETAPKDGTRIILRCPNIGAIEGWWDCVDGGGFEEGPPIFWWTTENDLIIFGDGSYDDPTHWMPLPPPPNNPNRTDSSEAQSKESE